MRSLALTLEFEGCVAVYDTGPHTSVGQHGSRRFLLDKVRSWAGVTGRINQRPGKDFFNWLALGPEAIALCRQVGPHLIFKAGQAGAVIRYPLGRQGVRLPPEMIAERRGLVDLTHKLNMTGARASLPLGAAERAAGWLAAVEKMPEEWRLQLLAASIDWEGTITISRFNQKAAERGYSFTPVVQLSQVGWRVLLLEIVRKLAGGVGDIHDTGRRGASLPAGWAPMKAWSVGGAEAVALAQKLAPAMAAKREQAAAVAAYPLWAKGRAAVPEAIFAERERLFEVCKAANAR